MPRYFFNIKDQPAPDKEGTALADLSAVRLAALELTGETLKHEGEAFWRTGRWHLDVSDESGAVLFSIEVAATGSEG